MTEILTSPAVIGGLVVIAVSCGVMLLLERMAGAKARVRSRLRELSGTPPSEGVVPFWKRPEGMMALLVPEAISTRVVQRLVPDEVERSILSSRLIQAGYYSTGAVAVFVTSKLLLMIAFPLLGAALGLIGLVDLRQGLLLGAIGGFGGLVIPGLWVDWRKTRRQRVLRRSLPDFLDLAVACLEGGMGIQAAMVQVNQELHPAHPQFSSELSVVQGEMDVGKPLDEAFLNLAERTGVEEVRWLATFVQQAQRFGSTMADAMRELSDLLRTQREQRAEELAQKAAVKILIPTLLCIFPAIFVVLAGPAAVKILEAFPKEPKTQAAAKP